MGIEMKRTETMLEEDRLRNSGKSNNLNEMVAEAALSINAQQYLPGQFGLVRLSTAYPKQEMAQTLATLDQRAHAGPPAFNMDATMKAYLALKPKPAAQLRAKIVQRFFGEGWQAMWAPKNMDAAAQGRAVAEAKRHSSDDEVKSNKAWAWLEAE